MPYERRYPLKVSSSSSPRWKAAARRSNSSISEEIVGESGTSGAGWRCGGDSGTASIGLPGAEVDKPNRDCQVSPGAGVGRNTGTGRAKGARGPAPWGQRAARVGGGGLGGNPSRSVGDRVVAGPGGGGNSRGTG